MLNENKMSEIIKSSLDGIREYADVDMSIGQPIRTDSGVTVIPVSKISVGMATGGVDYNSKRASSTQNFGGGGTTGVSVVPVAFLTIDRDAKINLIQVEKKQDSVISGIGSIIERSPELIERIKSLLS